MDFKKKFNQDGQVIRNKARLVCKGYAQVEGIDFEETYALVDGCQVCISKWQFRRSIY